MVSELVARLRLGNVAYVLDSGPVYHGADALHREAADRIEALEADNRMKDELLTAAVGDYNDALKALEPFAGDKLPGNNRDLIDYDRHGLRRAMSPMEVARRDAFFALHPEQHPLARSRTTEGENG